MPVILERCVDLPTRDLDEGDVLVVEGERTPALFVVLDGAFEVTRGGSVVAMITEPGALVGEISVLLDIDHSATVRATRPSRVHVVADPMAFITDDPEALLEIARMLARRLNRLVGYLADVKAQYGDASGHLGLVDEVLSELAFNEPAPVDPGSERDPDPYY